jgi:hypothetical protein
MVRAEDTLKDDIRLYAEKHYEDGYDVVVECWDDEEYDTFIEQYGIVTVEDFVVAYAPIKAHREDIMATAF